MHRRFVVWIRALTAGALLAIVPPPASPPAGGAPGAFREIRGIWVDGFHAGIKSDAELDTLIRRVQRAHANAIFAQVRKRGDAYYSSRYEPRALDDRTGRDPLRALIARAHAAHPRISVHAWINTAAVGEPLPGPGHILARHPDWRSLSDAQGNNDTEVVKIDPGVPGAAEWTYRVILDVARSYDVDGIHLDFIRYGGAHWGYAPESVARFNARTHRGGTPAWDDPDWQQWRRDQVTDLVRKVYANVVAIKPRLVVSAALIAWGDGPRGDADWTRTSAYNTVFQDWRAWLDEGILDLACPMTYFRTDPNRAFQEHWAEWIKEHAYDRAATIAVGAWLNTPEETFDLIRLNQAPSTVSGQRAAGTLLYSYGGMAKGNGPDGDPVFAALADGLPGDSDPPPWAGNVAFPDFPWKTDPARGHVKGTVLTGGQLRWADGAIVQIEGNGQGRTQRASGTGFFAFVDLPPGRYRLSVVYGKARETQTVTITPGAVQTADFLLARGGLPTPRDIAGVGREPNGARVLLPARTVTTGMDVLGGRFVIVDRIGATPLTVRAPKDLLLPIVRDDVVTVVGTLRTEQKRRFVDAEAAVVVGSRPLGR